MLTIVGKYWFCGSENIGIIVIQNENMERKAYIGTCSGENELADAEHIAKFGTPVHPDVLKEIIKELKG